VTATLPLKPCHSIGSFRPLIQTMTYMKRNFRCGLARNRRQSGIALSAWLSLCLAGPGHARVDRHRRNRLGASTPQITYTNGPETMPDSPAGTTR